MTKIEQVQGYVNATIERYGAVDYFINNAGIEGIVSPIIDSPINMFYQVINVNIRGV